MFNSTRMVEWGDCDPAGIVFYPNYYRWMDGVFQELAASCGFSQRVLREDHGMIGTPLVDTGCRFLSPTAYGETLAIAARIAHLGTSSMKLEYRFTIGDRVTAEGFEVRAFAAETGGRIAKAPIPDAIRAALAGLG